MRTNNKFNLHITPRSENSKPLGHIAAWAVSAVTTARLIPVLNVPIQRPWPGLGTEPHEAELPQARGYEILSLPAWMGC